MVTFIIADKSLIVRKGLISILGELKQIKIIKNANSQIELIEKIEKFEPKFVIINKDFLSQEADLDQLKAKYKKINFIQLTNSKIQNSNINNSCISIFEKKHSILTKLRKHISVIANELESNYESSQLTSREEDVIKYIALGYTNKELADKLFISPHTAITHRKNITKKLNIKTISGLTVYAILNNIIDANDLN